MRPGPGSLIPALRRSRHFARALPILLALAVLTTLAARPDLLSRSTADGSPVADSYDGFDAKGAEQLRQDQCLLAGVLRQGGPTMFGIAQDGLNQAPDTACGHRPKGVLRLRRAVRTAESGGLTTGPVSEGSAGGSEGTSEQGEPHHVTPTKGPSPWGQAVAAVAVVAALGVGLWMFGQTSSSGSDATAATCSDGKPETSPGNASRHVSGAQLCKALNRPDLAELLGMPGETAKNASGSDGSVQLAGGKDIDSPSAQVEFGTYTVTLSATYDRLPVAGSALLLGDGARQRTVLGRLAVLYSDHTISIRFRLDGSDADSGPGVPARALTVARDAKDSGGSFDVTLWRADGAVPDDAVLLRVAEKVLLTLPGWAANG